MYSCTKYTCSYCKTLYTTHAALQKVHIALKSNLLLKTILYTEHSYVKTKYKNLSEVIYKHTQWAYVLLRISVETEHNSGNTINVCVVGPERDELDFSPKDLTKCMSLKKLMILGLLYFGIFL